MRTPPNLRSLAAVALAAAVGPGCVDVHIYIEEGTTGEVADDAGAMSMSGFATTQSLTTAAATTATPDDGGDGADAGDGGDGADGGDGMPSGPDGNYPAPSGGACPEGYTYAELLPGFAVCSPTCTGDGCLESTVGNATVCAFNPASSNATCDDGGCADRSEACTPVPGGGTTCQQAPDHCVVVCTGEGGCPEGMSCTSAGACMYPL